MPGGPLSEGELGEERRAVYRERLREYLRDPAFRATAGFPIGDGGAIMAMSEPPYYTACPNPFLEEFVREAGRPYDADEPYHREPFAVDVSVGKTDALYRAHGYHTKVPHLAIVPSILHYTEPGDLVLDGFCGSGMTGVAAQWCGTAPEAYRRELAARFAAEGRAAPRWGARRAILNDLSPAATFIAANYTLPFEVGRFAEAARRLLNELDAELGWMYETRHTDGRTGRIDYTVWSQVYGCPQCGGDVIFFDEALNDETKRVREEFPCPTCGARLTKQRLDRQYEARFDGSIRQTINTPKRIPVLILYSVGPARFEKKPETDDLLLLERIASLPIPSEVSIGPLPYMHMTHERARMDYAGVTHVHHFFLPRAAQSLGAMWRKATAYPEERIRHLLLFFVEQAIWGMSVLNRYTPTHFSHVNQYLNGVYYIAAQHAEVSPNYILDGKLERLVKAFQRPIGIEGHAFVTTGTCASIPIPGGCIDYIFTDPPFGENIYYADLNFLVESWHRVLTDAEPEAIIDRAKRKGLPEYQRLMQRCFEEYFRVLKPGRWMTVCFHNSRNSVWNAIQEAMLAVGFVVADVRTMDKQQGSYRQVTSTAVKQDLVISAYKPTTSFEDRFKLEAGTADGAWDFVRQHLAKLPVVVEKAGVIETAAERQPYLLFDRMVAFHIQRGATVPLSAAEFYRGLRERFSDVDGMVFLYEQRPTYDAARLNADRVAQLALFVSDEKSSIQWLRQQLDPATGGETQTYQEIQPQFLRQLHQARYEQLPELSVMLERNFREDESGRWYVPDPNKASDLEKVREAVLLREFAGYAQGRGNLKQFRSEAVRAGFADAYRRGDYAQIVALAERLPEERLQEDPDLLMYYDNASLRVG
jgi:hypothetical protein